MIRMIILCLLVLTGLAGTAEAHAVLRGTEPADGAVLATPPAAATIRFNEPVRPLVVRVIGAAGEVDIDPAAVVAVDTAVTVPLPPLPDGRYLLSWRVTSADGHPVAGSIAFGVGGVSDAASPVVLEEGDALGLMQVTRLLRYAALLAAVGGGVFIVFGVAGGPPSAGAVAFIRASAAMAALVTALGVGVEGAALLGLPPGGLFRAVAWSTGAAGPAGPAALVTILGLVILLAGLEGRGRRLLVAAGCVVAVSALALTGHAGTAQPRWLSAPAITLHGLAAAFWVGSLPLLLMALSRSRLESVRLLDRFSRRAMIAVAVLVAAGAILAAIQLRAPQRLFDTPYGWMLTGKIALVTAMLALAAVNRWALVGRLDRLGRAGPLRWTIGAELTLAVAVLMATVGLGTTPPPRALAPPAEAATPCDMGAGRRATAETEGLHAAITLLPACVGENRLYLALSDDAGRPLDPQEVSLALALPAAGIEPVPVAITRTGAGRFTGESQAFVVPGEWSARIVVLIDDFTRAHLTAAIAVDPRP